MFALIVKTPPVKAGWAGALPFLAGDKAVVDDVVEHCQLAHCDVD